MDNERFMLEVEKSHNRSKSLLIKKRKEYTLGDRDRLEHFYRAGAAQAVPPHFALMGMAVKHFTSISDMCRNPTNYSIRQWNSKITDLRNYTYLLDALVRDYNKRSEQMMEHGDAHL